MPRKHFGKIKILQSTKKQTQMMKTQTQREIYESITKYQYLSVTNLYQFGKFINEETKSTWKIPLINR